MAKFSSFLIVLLLMLTSFTAGAQEYPRGDVNQDGAVNISDVTSLIDYLLKGTWPDEPVTPPDNHDWVDLGLPSGTMWATCNVGARSPEEYGYYFAWGETEPKEVYNWSTYKWCNGSSTTMTKYCTSSSFGNNGFVDNKTELDPEDDAAYMNWGRMWRIPTHDQLKELIDNCTWIWTRQNGVNGTLVTGPNGNNIFLPAAGWREGSSFFEGSTQGTYWSRTMNNSLSARELGFNSLNFDCGYIGSRHYGQSIRAVRISQN